MNTQPATRVHEAGHHQTLVRCPACHCAHYRLIGRHPTRIYCGADIEGCDRTFQAASNDVWGILTTLINQQESP